MHSSSDLSRMVCIPSAPIRLSALDPGSNIALGEGNTQVSGGLNLSAESAFLLSLQSSSNHKANIPCAGRKKEGFLFCQMPE